MKAWQIHEYGTIGIFRQRDLPKPQPKEGWVLIDIKTFSFDELPQAQDIMEKNQAISKLVVTF